MSDFKIVSLTIDSHLFMDDFNLILDQLNKLNGFKFIIKSKIYTLENIKDEKVVINSSDRYTDHYNLK